MRKLRQTTPWSDGFNISSVTSKDKVLPLGTNLLEQGQLVHINTPDGPTLYCACSMIGGSAVEYRDGIVELVRNAGSDPGKEKDGTLSTDADKLTQSVLVGTVPHRERPPPEPPPELRLSDLSEEDEDARDVNSSATPLDGTVEEQTDSGDFCEEPLSLLGQLAFEWLNTFFTYCFSLLATPPSGDNSALLLFLG